MSNINQNPVNTNQRSKAPLVLFIVSILILVGIGGYFVYAKSLNKTVDVAQFNEISNVVNNSTATANTTDQSSTATTQTTRDPNRYYNDKDGYSFVVPEGMEAKPAEDVYPPDNVAESHNIVIDTNIPESVRTGGSDWIPELSIVTSDDSAIDKSEYEEVQINKYTFLKKTDVIPEGEFWFSGEVYTYTLLINEKKYIISGFNKKAIESTVNSFEIL